MFDEKIKLLNLIDNSELPLDKKKNYVFIHLENTSKYLSSAYLCVKDFFKILRSSPELLYKILTKAEQKDLYNSSFIFFITNNFFNNILSSRTYSEELLLLITHLLYDQISSLKNTSDFQTLFENSNVFTLLKGIKYKRDIQKFFDLVLSDTIEEYENSENNSRPLIFNIDILIDFIKNEEDSISSELNNSVKEKKEEIQKKHNNEINELKNMYKMKFPNYDDSVLSNNSSFYNNSDNENDESLNKDSFDSEKFLSKYLVELTKKELIDTLDREKKEIMKNYIREQLEEMKNEEKYFGNSIILDTLQHSNNVEKILYHYQKNFYIVIDIIKKIIKKFNESIELVPYTLKYICKVISLSLKKQFKKITNIEIYKIIAEFFFVFVFKEFFLNPDYGTLITSIIISKETKKNLMIIFDIWKRLLSFKLYPNNNEYSHYIPFNWFFMEIIGNIFNFIEKILEFNLSDSLIDYKPKKKEDTDNNNNNKNNINLKISTFYSYSVCYNIFNLTTLLNIIKNNFDYIFENKLIKNEIAEFEIVFNNLKEKKDIFRKLKANDDQKVNYYIYYELFYSKKFQDILFKTINMENIFNIKEIKNPKNDEQKNLNKIIRCKNLLCELLFKSENLSKIDFNKQNVDFNNVEQIILSLSEYYKNKSILYQSYLKSMNNDIDIDYNDTNLDNSFCNKIYQDINSLPLDWYSNTLLSAFKELNDEKTNVKINYKELFVSLKDEINNTINKYNFEDLAQALESLKNTRNYINNYKENQEKYNYLNINTKIRNFIESEKIEVEIKFRYYKENKFISIIKTEDGINSKFQHLDEFLSETQKDKVVNCSNIPEFIKKFPPLTSIAKKLKKEVFIIEKEINLKKSLLSYLKIVKEHIKQKFGEKEIQEIYTKIKTTIMIRLYDKLFPKKPSLEDITFYNQCLILSWIEPKHLKQENLFFDNFLPITTSYFEQMNNEKSGLGKLETINKIFDAINNVILFNKGGNYSTDEIAPILEFAMIKARPSRFSSNLKYLQIFMKKDPSQKERMYFDFLKGNMNIIQNATYLNFFDVTEGEFNRKCKEMKDRLEKEFEIY